MEDKIASNDMRLEKENSKLDAIPTMNGFANVAAFKKALRKAKADLTAKEKSRKNGEDQIQNRKLHIGAYLRM